MHGYPGLVVLALVCQSALAGDAEASHATDKGSVLVAAMVSPAGLKPSIQVLAAANFALGGWFSAGGERRQPEGEGPTSSTTTLSFGPEVTYFLGKPGSTSLPYLDGRMELDISTVQGTYQDYKYTQVGLGLAVGVCQLIGRHGTVMGEAGCTLRQYRSGYDNNRASSSIVGFYIAAGFGGFIF